MSMLFSASSRGGSALGVLVTLTILSAVAIGIDAKYSPNTSPYNPSALSQMAAVEAGSGSASSATETKTEADVTQGCVLGYDYVARLEKGNMVVQTTLDGTNPTPSAQANKCDPPKDANGNIKSLSDGRMCATDGSSPWKCKLRMCVPKELTKDGKNPECKYMKEVPLGDQFNSYESEVKTNASEQVKDNIALATPERATQIAKASSGVLGNDFSNNLFDAFGGQKELDAIPAKVYEKDQLLRLAEAHESCVAQPHGMYGPGTFNECPTYTGKSAAELKQDIDALQKQEQTLRALSENKAALQPSAGCQSEACASGETTSDPRFAPTQTFENKNADNGNRGPSVVYRDSPSDPYRAFLGSNTGQEQDRYLCERYRDQAACMRLSTGGYGGYGNSMGQTNRCGSQPNFGGGFGGIIGGIISLFSRNSGGNSNCTPDGVPLPQCTLTASPKNIEEPGKQVTLSWQSQDAFAATLSSRGSVSVNGSETVQPQQTTTYTLSLQGYRNTQTGQVLSGQCSTQVTVGARGGSGTAGNEPKAQISCSPQMADVGMSIAISYSCLNSNTSGGSGFPTNNQMSGSATPVVTSPAIGSDTVTYGLTCSKEGKTDSAQCTVKVNKTAIVLVANPKDIESGSEVNIGWVTTGMQSCTISSPDLPGFTSENASNQNVSGGVRTPSLSEDTTFVLTCTTRSGATKTAETKVEVSQ